MFVQNQDRNASRGDYAKLGVLKLLITKIFPTIQGEGPFAGCPAIFVRLAGCNRGEKVSMGCSFCDTAFQIDKGKVMEVEEIVVALHLLVNTNAIKGDFSTLPLIVITGGEPMLQDNLTQLVIRLVDDGFPVQIESNGDRLARNFNLVEECRSTHLVVSPKKNPGRPYRKLDNEVLARLDCFKFLFDASGQTEYNHIPEYVKFTKKPVYVSPMAIYKANVSNVSNAWNPDEVDQSLTAHNYREAAALCQHMGYRLSIQTHLFCNIE